MRGIIEMKLVVVVKSVDTLNFRTFNIIFYIQHFKRRV